MKALSKPLSSPGRADKFPPPLMRFLRSNVGSRSRGRSRSSPLFYLRSRKNRVPIETTQEPSSPKVTCIGQVRVRRAAKSTRRPGAAEAKSRSWWWVKKPVFCGGICSRVRRPKSSFGTFFCKWGSFFRFGYCKKVDSKEDAFRVLSDKNGEKSSEEVPAGNNNTNFFSSSIVVSESDFDKKDSTETACSCPPKNALILTRCRSAPYRSSSLGGRFCGSPLAETTKADGETGSQGELEPRISGESRKEFENSSVSKDDGLKGSRDGGGAVHVHPLVLTRCKSEPARTGERLIPESNFSTLNS